MAMSTEKKLYLAVGVLALLGGVFFLQKKQASKVAASYSQAARSAELPDIKVKGEDADQIDKITIQRPPKKAEKSGDDDATEEAAEAEKKEPEAAPPAITLAKKDDKWQLMEPVVADANQTNVSSLITSLKSLEVSELIDATTSGYAKYDLTDESALHVVFHKGADVFREFWFGKGGGRGQMARIKGKEGVFAVKGYSKYSYDRDVKEWRERGIFKFEDKQVKAVSLTNENGAFEFLREADAWKGKFKKAKTGAFQPIKDFNEAKVKDLINAYKNLNADGFGNDKTPADTGLEKPVATLLLSLEDGGKREVQFGSNAEGSSRWIKTNQAELIYSISSWAADWATSDLKKFQKDAKKDDSAAPVGDDEDHGE